MHKQCEAHTLGVSPIPMFLGFQTFGVAAVPLFCFGGFFFLSVYYCWISYFQSQYLSELMRRILYHATVAIREDV